MAWARAVALALGCLLLASVLAVSTPDHQVADAYAVTDLPPLPTYCHPEMTGTVWPNQPAGCTLGLAISDRYDCCNPDGSLIEYGGPVFSRPTVAVTSYGSLSSPPTFIVTADYSMWPDDGLRRVDWKRLTFRVGAEQTALYADPVAFCGLKATTCTYKFDAASMTAALNSGLGSPPSWIRAPIRVPVQSSPGATDGDGTFDYATGTVGIGVYKTDNKTPVANIVVSPNPGTTVSYHFDGRTSKDTDGDPIARYVWDFGDGSVAAEGAQVDHTYAAAGSYRVTLRVLDPQGAQGSTFTDLKRQLTISNVAISKIPKVAGDEFDLTVTARNDSSDAMPCVSFFSNIDIRPTTSFTKISGPGSETTTLARGATLTKTWRYELKDPVPAAFDIYPSATGGGGTDCSNTFDPTHVIKKTTYTISGTQPWAPFANWAALVKRQYQDVLGRVPTSAESSSWVAKLTNLTSTPGTLVDSLRRSTDNTANVDATARLYRALLGRTPDASGLNFWIGRRRAGTWTLVKMADNFAGSSEFKRKYGTLTNQQYVTRIYTDVLGRAADPSGVSFWTRQLDQKKRTRGSVMVGFSESNEYKTKQAETTDGSVAHIFLLGKAPTTTELQTWVTAQKGGTTHVALLQQILSSPAYATRVGG